MIDFEIKNETALITLANPDKRNALSPELVKVFKEKFSDAENDVRVKSIIITGKGKAFCAGADLSYLEKISKNSLIENVVDSNFLSDFFLMIYECNKPTIASVNGAAIAGGCGLATACDFIVASSEASFGYSEVKIGFIPAIVSYFLLKRLGEVKAKQLLISGEIINAAKALDVGLVDYVNENHLQFSFELAERLNQNSTLSIQETKKLIRNISHLNYKNAIDLSLNLNALSRTTDDFKNGLSKFLRKDK